MQIRSSNQTIRKKSESTRQKAESLRGEAWSSKTESNTQRELSISAGASAPWSKEEYIRRAVRPQKVRRCHVADGVSFVRVVQRVGCIDRKPELIGFLNRWFSGRLGRV